MEICSFLSKFRKTWKTLFSKRCRDFISLSSFERLFHSSAAATLKAFSPIAVLVLGILKVLLSLSALLCMLECFVK